MGKRWSISLTGLCLLFAGCASQRLHEGDLLFHVTDRQSAITEVTPGMIDHVAIVLSADSVIEAVGRGVVVTPISELLKQDGYFVVGRVSDASRFLGRSYDYLYLPDNDEIYCSELVQLSFVNKKGQPLFTTVPMSFHDSSGQVTAYWVQFYAEHHMTVPEGHPGTNPGELSQRDCVSLCGRLR